MRYHTPDKSITQDDQPLSVHLDYDRTEISMNESITATASVANQMDSSAAMVIDLPPQMKPVFS